jgi:TetR/AcrR family transcriptional regulator, transcriptional repressor of bet genes
MLTGYAICERRGKLTDCRNEMNSSAKPAARPRKERKDNADKRRRQILDATFRSIVANGLGKTTLATVAAEAGLSQGVAVFYFKSKNGMLTEALRDLYEKYESHWLTSIQRDGLSPAECLRAIVEADFDPKVCNAETLSVWFAFWGEQKFTPQYAEITEQYDSKRSDAIRQICRKLSPNDPVKADLAGDWIDTMTDGYWQKMHLFPQTYSRELAIRRALQLLQTLFSDVAGSFK